MAEDHNRAVSDTATTLRVYEPAVLLTAYSTDGEPTVVLSTDETVEDRTDAMNDLLGAVVTAVANERGTSKEAIANYLRDRAEGLQVEAIEEQHRYDVAPKDDDVELDLPEDG